MYAEPGSSHQLLLQAQVNNQFREAWNQADNTFWGCCHVCMIIVSRNYVPKIKYHLLITEQAFRVV
jgi:hypothetical protein